MFKSRVTAKYNVVDSVWYHGRASTNPSFDLEFVGKGNDQQGPAFYFTSDIKDATGYAYHSGIVITAQVQPKKLVEGKAKAAEVEKLIRKSPVFHDALSNYDENPGTAFRIAFKGIMDQGSALDSFLSVWYEFYRYHPRAYLENIVELGYDGHLVPKQGGVQHLMIYNPKVIKVLEETPYSEVQAEVKASASPMSFIRKLKKLAKTSSLDAPDILDEIEYDPELEGDPENNLESFFSDIEQSLEMLNGKLLLYRAVSLEDKQKFLQSVTNDAAIKYGIDGVGTSWSYKEDGAVAYWATVGSTYILKGLVDPKHVDEIATLHLASRFGDGEAEIRLQDKAPVKLLEISNSRGKKTPINKMAVAEVKPIEHFRTFEDANKKHWSLQGEQTQ